MTIFGKPPREAMQYAFWVRIFDKTGHIMQDPAVSLDTAINYARQNISQTEDIVKIEIIDSETRQCVWVIQKDLSGNIVIVNPT